MSQLTSTSSLVLPKKPDDSIATAFTSPFPSAVDPYQGTAGVPSHGGAEEIFQGMLRELETRGGLLPCAMLVGRKPDRPEYIG